MSNFPIIAHIVSGTIDDKHQVLGVFDTDTAASNLVKKWALRSDDIASEAWLINGIEEEAEPVRLLVKPIYSPKDTVVIDDGDVRGVAVVDSCDGDVRWGEGSALYKVTFENGQTMHMLGKDIIGAMHKIE